MTIRIEKRGKRIEVKSHRTLTGMKDIPGAYLTASGYWTVPCTFESCVLLREKFGRALEIGTQLDRWSRMVRNSRDTMGKLSAANDAPLRRLKRAAPKIYRATGARRYQRAGIRFVADSDAMLLADDPGLGKTLMTMGGLLEAGIPGPYLVIAPKTATKLTWAREIKRWLPPDHIAVTLPQTRARRAQKLRTTYFGKKTWLLVHPEICLTQTWWVCEKCSKRTKAGNRQKRELDCGHIKSRKTKKLDEHNFPRLFQIEWGAIVVDESHESLIRRSGVPTQRRNGIDKLKLREGGVKIAISGTPMEDKPEQLWGTLNWLDPATYGGFHRWVDLYWQKDSRNSFKVGAFRQEREPMLWDSLSDICLRRTKAEVAEDLPPKLEIGTPLDPSDENSPKGIWLEMDGKQAKAYDAMMKHSAAELESGRLDAIYPLVELTRLKQFACSYGDIDRRKVHVRCEKSADPHKTCRKGYHVEWREKFIPTLPSNKFQWLVENLEEWGYPKNPLSKVVIVSLYTGLLERVQLELEKHFRTKPGKRLSSAITGRVSMKDRERVLDRFNTPGEYEHLMMLNVKAGGVSITIDTADKMVFLSETRIPSQQIQTEDRIHRISNPRQCFYYYLRSIGTVDVGTAIVNRELDAQSRRLMDERRGIEYVRKVMSLSEGYEW